MRDYIHVMDVAEGHLNAMDNFFAQQGYRAYNLGAGVGYSILDRVRAFEKASGKTIPYEIVPRRQGDLAAFWADAHLVEKALGWCAKRSLNTILRDTWNWQRANPNGDTR